MSSSFSLRACRASHACERGEAAWAHNDRCSYHWASQFEHLGVPRGFSLRAAAIGVFFSCELVVSIAIDMVL